MRKWSTLDHCHAQSLRSNRAIGKSGLHRKELYLGITLTVYTYIQGSPRIAQSSQELELLFPKCRKYINLSTCVKSSKHSVMIFSEFEDPYSSPQILT